MVYGTPSLPIPKIENRHIRCQNAKCNRCTPRRKRAELSLKPGHENKAVMAVKNREAAISQAHVISGYGNSQTTARLA
jgi:hypothetical protein